ncbi:MAG: hypothetical protein ACE5HA_00050 [Anaerolineae bacterium]
MDVASGEAGFLTSDLGPGNYAVICRPSDPDAGQSNGVFGMMRGFKAG